ncbi:hypothetical protein CLV98_1532 [Dyadobacter jejuensis]|uniref:Uncharacterized protein n=2 Tax=Dyadobacter jejuensis TaxID=1082580 RepID=A0A315ZU70_9BACT|nr:hypothetical protein CLV98_1532 [Dyadobacter jejuensis]
MKGPYALTMAKKERIWRVIPMYVGKVTIESQKKQVVLTNELSQEQLLELTKDPIALGFLEQTTLTEPKNGEENQ